MPVTAVIGARGRDEATGPDTLTVSLLGFLLASEAGCDFDFDISSILGGGGSYSKKEITSETVSTIKSNISENTVSNASYLKYEATYSYDYNKLGEYIYNTKFSF